ncbi:MAG: hypothetical protein K0R77_3246 [Chryseobacterium sp.]|jgi:hypothetical protein|uniref:C-type lectin domain-containing protein n=1 Tax=Chryseobacterium sp. TaxID=1871047 RepID=UPI00260F12E1|nr:C-type lectin domain-containing protein [Chryseobacterium sp.]MDF2553971.1 hypothetical protein [Chryseobacterium sp.]
MIRKILLTVPLLAATICLYGQSGKAVGVIAATDVVPIDFPHSSAILDVRSSDKGFLAPRVALASLTNASPITTTGTALKTGLLVYNSTDNAELDKGYYYWNGVQWLPWRKSSNIIQSSTAADISTATLGYVPQGTGATAPATFTYGNVKGTKVGCFKFTVGNNHSFCGYDLKDTSNAAIGVNWSTSFAMAKSINGYLATATSTEEWDFIKTNLLPNTLPSQNQNNAWLGFNKVTYPGNPKQFTWITGEKSMVAWERAGIAAAPDNANASFEFNFADSQPDDAGNAEGCVHIFPASHTGGANRYWNDAACTSTSISGATVSYLIVEFQN